MSQFSACLRALRGNVLRLIELSCNFGRIEHADNIAGAQLITDLTVKRRNAAVIVSDQPHVF